MLTILNKTILLKLLKEERITFSSFLKENNISGRSFEYNIRKINEILEKINIKICCDGETYYIGTEDEKRKIFTLLEMTKIIDRADRLLMMKFLLFFDMGINLQKFSKNLEISLTTAKKDLNLIKLEFEEIEYKKNKGFLLKFPVEESRKLELLKEIMLNSQVYDYLSSEYRNFFSKSEEISNFLDYIKKDLNIKITTENHLLLQVYVLLILNKTEIKKLNNNESFIKETEEFKVINNYWKRKNMFSANKILKITDLIIGLSIKTNNLENWLNEEILVKKIIKKFSDYVELNIEKDQVLYECLMYHLKPAIYRLKKGIKLNNTIFKELLQEDDTTLQITNEVLKEIEEDLEIKFNDDEKYLLAYHFKASLDRNMYIDRKKILLVCGLGYGTSKLLEKQLKENFNIDVVDIIAFHELDEAIKIYKNLDLIVSTLDIEKNIKIPYIKLDTFLNENECQKIINKGIQRKRNRLSLSELLEIIEWGRDKDKKKVIELLKEKYRDLLIDDLSNDRGKIGELISLNRIRILEKVDDWEEGIRITGKLLETSNLVTSVYIDDMITTVRKFGAYIVIDEDVAIPHGNIENTLKNGIAILVLKKPVNFNSVKKAKILIGFSINDKKDHKEILDIVFKIAEKKDKLLQFVNEQKIYNYLLEVE